MQGAPQELGRQQGRARGLLRPAQSVAFHKGRDRQYQRVTFFVPRIGSPPGSCFSFSGASWTRGVSGVSGWGVWLIAEAPGAEPECDMRGSEELDQMF